MSEGIISRFKDRALDAFGAGSDPEYVTEANPGAAGVSGTRIIFTDTQKALIASSGNCTDKGLAACYRSSGITTDELLALYNSGDVNGTALMLAGVPLPATKGRTIIEAYVTSPAIGAIASNSTPNLIGTDGQVVSFTVPKGQSLRFAVMNPESTATPPVSAKAERLEVSLVAESVVTNTDGSITHTFTTRWLQHVLTLTAYAAMAAGAQKALIRAETYA